MNTPLFTVNSETRNGDYSFTGPNFGAMVKEHMEANGVVFPDGDPADIDAFLFTSSNGITYDIRNGSLRVTFTDVEDGS